MNLFKRWKDRNNKPTAPKPIAQFCINVYDDDRVEFTMNGGEVMVGGAIITLMLRNPQIHAIINNAVVATERELTRHSQYNQCVDFFTINLN